MPHSAAFPNQNYVTRTCSRERSLTIWTVDCSASNWKSPEKYVGSVTGQPCDSDEAVSSVECILVRNPFFANIYSGRYHTTVIKVQEDQIHGEL